MHREISGGAALFFERFSPEDLADKVIQLVDSPALRSELREKGLKQSVNFSWKNHVERLLEISTDIATTRR